VNFGGPGASAVEIIERFPIDAGVRARFDIVGMDPRGVGQSTPLDCGLDPATVYGADPTVEDAADARALVSLSEEYAADCADERGDLLPHVGTRDVARDMDAIRAAMGDETLSYLGYSYGTSIGQVYAELFPDRVRSLVLDGVVDPAPAGVDIAKEQARGFEVALGNWASACPSRSSCPFGDEALAMVDEMLERSEATVPSSGGARPLGRGEASVGLAFPLYQEALWGALDRAVADALDGDGAGMVALADRYLGVVDFSAYFAVSCLDSEWPDRADDMLAAAEAAGVESPRFGEAIVNDYLRCAVWPAEPDPIGAVTAPGTPPILVVSTTGDPATPYENGVRVADRLESGLLLTNDGEGHTIVFQGSSCVDAVVVAYLVDGRAPEDGTRC
jgi:pimeloyl-ACP methyl ester carboxylesterase